MELELKHIAPYLPYGLNCQYEGIINGREISKQRKEFQLKEIFVNYDAIDEIKGLKIAPLKTIKTYKKYWVAYCGIYNNGQKAFYNGIGIKPLLRPLSQLTKEIEHNGEKFVPLEFIMRMIEPEDILIDKSSFDFNIINESIGYNQVFQLRYKTDYDNYKKFVMLNFHQQEKCFWHTERIIPFSCIEKLLEWHFDIHGLIENNLAIEIK